MLEVLGILVALVAIFLISLVLYARRNYGTLEKLNIPVIKPSFVFGSDVWGYKNVQHLVDIDRMKKYGHVYGVYQGSNPEIHINDPQLLKLIMVKDYSHFSNRNVANFGNPVANEMLDWLQDEKWKHIRSMLSQSFSLNRVKSMSKVLAEIANEHVKNLHTEFPNGSDRCKLYFKEWMTMVIIDMIGKAYCGIEFNDRLNPKNEMCELMRHLLGEKYTNTFGTYNIIPTFPFLRPFFPSSMPEDGITKISKLVDNLIASRKATKTSTNDFLGSLLTYWEKCETEEFQKLGITHDTIKAQALEFFLVTYDSVGTPIVHFIYYMAMNPEVQEKLLLEIDTTAQKYDNQFSYEAISDMPYLTACMSEAYRLCPAFFRAERLCTKTWTHESLTIPKGMTVMFPLWAVNRHPDYHEDPEAFNPERFMPGKKEEMNPYAYSTFGFGPKNCVGMKWGYDMSKLILARFLYEFKVEKRSDTVMNYKLGNTYIPQYDPVYIDIVKRHEE